jgi:PAS domain S-box-containing protein
MVIGMAVLRLYIYPNTIVPLTYALPLLVVLAHRDLRLHWAMALSFVAMVAVKFAFFLPAAALEDMNQWVFVGMQLANIILPAAVLHWTVRLSGRLEESMGTLERTNAELEASNEELAAREEEITQQNEELQSQAEELEQQTEELNTQAEELQGINEELAARERTMGDLLESSAGGAGEAETLATMGATLRRLIGPRAVGAAVLEPRGADMLVRPLLGMAPAPAEGARVRRDRAFAELVTVRDRAGALADVSLRPDLETPALEGGRAARSVAAAPVRVGDGIVGALEVYSDTPTEWNEHDLRLVQWMADQCGRVWTNARLREDLRAQQLLLRTISDSSSVALFMTDAAGVCVHLNPAGERLTGYTLPELRAGPLHEVLKAQGPDGAPPPIPAPRPDEPAPLQHGTLVRKGGTTVEVAVSSCPVTMPGEATGRLVEVIDVTEQRQYETEREGLLQSERAARSEAERANHAKDEFVATLSHELRTPLNAVLGWAALLRKNAANPAEIAKGIEVIERNARHQSQLISDLLDISRITAGKIRLDVQAVDVPLVVEGALEAVRPAAEAKGVRLDRVIETMDRVVMGDPGRLQQVVWNLLSNAIKFTPRDGRVQVVVSRVASYVQISVSDTGEGIDAELLPHLFERYRQADGSSSRRHGGLGLGLAIAKHLIELHGGSIHARSDGPGKGASFSILLPVRAAEPHDAADGPHPLTQAAIRLDASAPTLQGFCVLVVDDEEDARDLVGRILRDRGASVLTASSAQEALALLEHEHPNMLVSDIGMPGMDGYTLVRTIRERWPESARDMPAVALTAFARSEDRTRALLAGFQSHIAKPVEAAELVATVASLRYAIPGLAQQRAPVS